MPLFTVLKSKALMAVGSLTAAVLMMTACAGAPEASSKNASDGYPVTVENCGKKVTVDARPERGVTLNQGATEVALALGLQDQLVGTAYLDDDVPAKWKKAYESVKVLADEYPDHETLLAAEPDVVYASYAGAFDKDVAGSPAELQESGITAYRSPFACDDTPDKATFELVWTEATDIATIFGVPDRAKEIKQDQQKGLEKLAEEHAGEGMDVFWFDSGDKTAFAGAGQGGPQLILDAIGANNIFADLEGGWKDVSWEKVIKADPDVIVVADAAWSTAKDKIADMKNDPALKELRAVKNDAFVTIPFSESTPGIRLVDGAKTVAKQLNEMAE